MSQTKVQTQMAPIVSRIQTGKKGDHDSERELESPIRPVKEMPLPVTEIKIRDIPSIVFSSYKKN